MHRTGLALHGLITGGALNRAGVALQRTGDPPDRTGGAIERPRHVLPLEPVAAHTAGPLISCPKIAPKEHLRPTGMVRHAGKYCLLYLVVELSPSA